MTYNRPHLTPAQMPDQTMPAWLAILKICRVPFWILWTTPLLIGYLGSAHDYGAHHIVWFVLAVGGVWLGDAVASLHNELVDREEDAVNQPERAVLLASVSEQTTRTLIVLGYAGLMVGAVTYAIAVGALPALILAAGALAGPLYNWGPRFKRRPPLPQLVFAWVALCEMAGGWVLNGPLSSLSPVAWLVALFIAVASVAKDLPDVEGDEAVGAHTVFSIRRAATRRAVLVAIHLSPYLLLAVMVAERTLPTRLLWISALLPPAMLIVYVGERASTAAAKVLTYELSYLYVHLFLLGLLITMWPSATTVLVSAVMVAARLGAVAAGLEPRFVANSPSLRDGARDLLARRG